MAVNVSRLVSPEKQLAGFFRTTGQAARIQILLAIGASEACVCHLEACLGLRQATISQHLMVLRDAGLVITSREGRHIYYRLADLELLELLHQAARLVGVDEAELAGLGERRIPGCPCPRCDPSAREAGDCV